MNYLLELLALLAALSPVLPLLSSVLLSEERLTLNEVAKRSGVNPSTVWRWVMKGVKGVRLETYVLGGKRFSSVEALERFSAECTAASTPAGQSAPLPRTAAKRERDIARAEAELAKMGV